MPEQQNHSDLLPDNLDLPQFERLLNPRSPESSPIPTRVIGHGEISSVLQIGEPGKRSAAYKRMPMFESLEEAAAYAELVRTYEDLLSETFDFRLPASEITWFEDSRGGWVVCYIIQEVLDPSSIGNQLLHHLSDNEIQRLFASILGILVQIFSFNRDHKNQIEVGFDGQISNWAVANLQVDGRLSNNVQLIYFDTSSPLLRHKGKEQLNTELFLRSAPSFLRGIVRALFLEEVSTRYYDMRQVLIDLLANLYKEQRADLIPILLEPVNATLFQVSGEEPITLSEIRSYYRQDAFIWRLYLSLRKLDRRLYELRGRPYPFILPDNIRR